MRVTRWMAGGILCCGALFLNTTGAAKAADEQSSPGTGQYVYYQQPPAPPSTAATSEPAAEEEEEAASEPVRLIGKVGDSNLNIYGWIDAGVTANALNPASNYNGFLAPNDRNEFQANQLYLVMEKALDLEANDWDIGGRVDLLYGTDWIYCASLGLETHPDGSPRWNASKHYGLAMPQIYGEVGFGDLSLKLGHFYTIIGYESMMATSNFFYSHNYAVRYAEPTAHTGGLFTWKTTDELSLFLGGVNGQDRFDGQTDTFSLLTGFNYTPESKEWAYAFGLMTAGRESGLVPVNGLRTYLSNVLTLNPSERLQLVSQFDAGWQDNYDFQGNQAQFWSYTQYFFYTLNDCWKSGLRYDLFSDDQGTRLGGLRFGGTPGGNPLNPSGYPGKAQAVSAGLNYSPNANLRVRPELRWDWFDGDSLVFGDLTRNGQFSAAVDAIIQF